MFVTENEEIENQSGVENEVSQEPQIDSPQEQQAGQESQQAATQQPKEVPFHEHPRWKEVMEERNAERQARTQLEKQLAEMQRQIQEASKPKSNQPDFNEVRTKMGERLKGIDPEFQAYMGMLEEQAMSAKQELQSFREEQFVERAVGRFDELTKKDNVPQEFVGLYRAQLDQAYREGKIRNLGDLENAYKSIHEPMNKLLEAREKSALEKYTAEKKAAATKPASQPKGKPANPSSPKTFANEQEQKAALISRVANELRASRSV